MTDLILAKLKEIVILQDIVKKDDINYKSKRGKITCVKINCVKIDHFRICVTDLREGGLFAPPPPPPPPHLGI